jgi:hypothetical protein
VDSGGQRKNKVEFKKSNDGLSQNSPVNNQASIQKPVIELRESNNGLVDNMNEFIFDIK